MRALTATDLLREARRLLDAPAGASASAWPRATALLSRQALESAIETFWRARAPGMEDVRSTRAQLSCLRFYLDDDALASEIVFAWASLSGSTHHRPFELDPTCDELASLVAATERAVGALLSKSVR